MGKGVSLSGLSLCEEGSMTRPEDCSEEWVKGERGEGGEGSWARD
jgi:hypothetical protein